MEGGRKEQRISYLCHTSVFRLSLDLERGEIERCSIRLGLLLPWPKAAAAPQKTICGEAGVRNEQYKQMTHLPRLRRSSIRRISIAVGGGEMQKAPSSEIGRVKLLANVLALMAGKRLLSEAAAGEREGKRPLNYGRGNRE
jgi:hypothetical protein